MTILRAISVYYRRRNAVYNFHNVKANWCPNLALVKHPIICRRNYPLLFIRRNCFARGTERTTVAAFYFDKNIVTVFMRDNVYFAKSAIKIAFQYSIAVFLQVFNRYIFAKFTNRTCVHSSTLTKFPIKLRLCIGQGPYSLSNLICSAVPYPLCLAKLYCGYCLS